MLTTEQLSSILSRGVAETIDRRSLENKLRRHRPLRVKLGIDPTSHQLHLGHTVPLRKLRAFQDAGHRAILIIGDYTARVGDPTGRDKSRSPLSAEQTKRFASTYLEQVGSILDLRRTEVRHNSEWFEKFSAADFLKLAMTVSANTLLSHETFRRRLDRGLPLGVHELFYPLLQGYDSVAVEADVELGGTDQKFSLLVGRDVQAAYGLDRQDIMLFDYLIGTDGKEKMSKSIGNTIALEDEPNEMYGKTMSIPDKLIIPYFTLVTDTDPAEVATMAKELRAKKANPRDVKAKLARTIVGAFHGEAAGTKAEFEFAHVFRKKGQPTAMPEILVRSGAHPILNFLVSHHLASSRSEARRLVEQGGVRIDDRTISDWEQPIEAVDGAVVQIGKRKFFRLKIEK